MTSAIPVRCSTKSCIRNDFVLGSTENGESVYHFWMQKQRRTYTKGSEDKTSPADIEGGGEGNVRELGVT